MSNDVPTPPPTLPILRYFEYDHLPPHLADVSKPFYDLAHQMHDRITPNTDFAEHVASLRKLLEAKDGAVRTTLSSR